MKNSGDALPLGTRDAGTSKLHFKRSNIDDSTTRSGGWILRISLGGKSEMCRLYTLINIFTILSTGQYCWIQYPFQIFLSMHVPQNPITTYIHISVSCRRLSSGAVWFLAEVLQGADILTSII